MNATWRIIQMNLSSEGNRIAVFGSGGCQPGSEEWNLAREAGVLLAGEGFITVTGGYGGVMEAVSYGAISAGGKAHAILHSPPEVAAPNSYVTSFTVAEDYPGRLAGLLRIPLAFALPGSMGTLAEIAASIALLHRHHNRRFALWSPFWYRKLENIYPQLYMAEGQLPGFAWLQDLEQLRTWLLDKKHVTS